MVGTVASCEAILAGGGRCHATPMRGVAYCFFHNPGTTEEAAEARRLGGVRRRREGTLAGVYDLDSVCTLIGLRRILEVAAYEALALDGSVAKVRALTTIVQVGARLLETSDLEVRLAALEAAIRPRAQAW